jgi:hypothetical protein
MISTCHIPERLLFFCGLRLDFEIRQTLRRRRAIPINVPPS